MSGIEDLLNAVDSDDDSENDDVLLSKDDLLESLLISNSDDEDEILSSNRSLPLESKSSNIVNSNFSLEKVGEDNLQTSKIDNSEIKQPINVLFEALTRSTDSSKVQQSKIDELLASSEEEEDCPTALDDSLKRVQLNVQGVTEDDINGVDDDSCNSLLYTCMELSGLEESYRAEKLFLLNGHKDVNTALTQQLAIFNNKSQQSSFGSRGNFTDATPFTSIKSCTIESITQQLQKNAHSCSIVFIKQPWFLSTCKYIYWYLKGYDIML